MKTLALIEKGKDGTYSVYTPDLPSVIWGEGATVADAKADFLNTLKEVTATFNKKIPKYLKNIEFTYKYDLSSVFNYYNFINASKLAEYIGINASLMRQYKNGSTYISEAQSARIEKALHTIGKEFTSISIH